ncbi:flavin reductase (DIM6/NTAB) family NADH-FMN oxidoreductase RutF [Phyllobacterium trifolii]|uniref:Flavin reductase (DIM6/NTAB) family NADH-FMN oxidoreductase RutF n=1 Tax=Phyllobacterium trifolii TaxID=300193 RepID=A0A839UFB2_9HYPH|nr:flavin reductase family protein [Phyllobacterium trifolii]MBB3148524.1 flavin reductase (DIM6/NTAB) family NADH-FMN oxidoreductase RutF [Phyllobacterium trifolii]
MTLNIGKILVNEIMTKEIDLTLGQVRKDGNVGLAGREKTATEFWIPESLEVSPDATSADYKLAMRLLAGGVAAITVGSGAEMTGFTATSVVSLSAEPPRLMFGISQTSSSWKALTEGRAFAVNLLNSDANNVADRFAGRAGVKGIARYDNAEWKTRKTGVQTLASAMAGFDCEVEEILLRYDHAIVIGRVKEAWISQNQTEEPLLYWQGAYGTFS